MYLKKTNSQCPLSSSARLGTCLGSLHLPRRTCGHYKATNVRLAFTSSAVSPHHHLMPLLPIYTMDFTAPLDVRLSQHVKEPFPRGRVRTSPFAANLTLLGDLWASRSRTYEDTHSLLFNDLSLLALSNHFIFI